MALRYPGTSNAEITEYAEIFYNPQRKQARLGYLPPAAFTQRYYEKKLVAKPVVSTIANQSHYICATKPLGII